MALENAQLSHLVLGPGPISGGLDLRKPTLIGDDAASRSENFQHIEGILGYRDQLRNLLAMQNTSARWTRLAQYTTLATLRFLLALSKNKILRHNGTSVTDITGSGKITGSPTDLDPWTSANALGLFFATNGVSDVILWDGAAASVTILNDTTGYVDPAGLLHSNGARMHLVARYCASFAGRLVLAYMTEGSTVYSTRVRWCGNGRYLDWYPTAGTGSGVVDIQETDGEITGLWTLDDKIVVAKTDSLSIGQETGDIRTPLVFPLLLATGCLSGQSFQAISPTVGVFLGTDNMYRLEGSSTVPIGDKIRARLLSELNRQALRQIVSWVQPDKNLYFMAVPNGSNTEAVTVYVYNYSEDKWWTEIFSTKAHSAAQTTLGVSASPITWDSIVGTWDQQTRSWDSYKQLLGSTRVVVGTQSGGATWDVHDLLRDNNATDTGASSPAQAVWESKEFKLNPKGKSTVHGVTLHLEDSTAGVVQVSVSADYDRIQTNSKTFALGSRSVFIPFKIQGRTHRISIVCQARLAIGEIEVLYSLRRTLA